MKPCHILLVTIIASQLCFGQSKKNKECFLAMDIPERLAIISSSDKEAIYRDKKSNSILTFTKVNIQNCEFNLAYTAEAIAAELSEDPRSEGLSKSDLKVPSTDAIVLRWKWQSKIANRVNNYHSLALMNICDQYYTFEFSMPEKKQEELIPIFMQILKSVEKMN